MKGFLEARVKGVPALMPGRVEAHLAHLFATESGGPAEEREQRTPQAEVSSNEPGEQKETPLPKQLPTSLSPEQRSELTQQNEARHDWIEQLGAQDRRVKGRSYQRMADYLVSTTDPNATLMETTKGADFEFVLAS